MITDNYIKMCEKAEEIQKSNINIGKRHFNNQDFVAYNCGEGLKIYVCSEISRYWLIKELIWLPTQEQLQEISGIPWWRFDKRCDGVRCCLLEDPLNNIEIRTKEEAGICVVMEKKYNKIWTGEKWEAIK